MHKYINNLAISVACLTGCKPVLNILGPDKEPKLKIQVEYNGSYEFSSPTHLIVDLSMPVSDGPSQPLGTVPITLRALPENLFVTESSIQIPSEAYVTATVSSLETDGRDKAFRAFVSGFLDLSKVIPIKVQEDLGGAFTRDNGGVYAFGKSLPDCDPNSFALIANSTLFARDSLHVYRGNQLIEGADPNSFVALNNAYQKDAKTVYHDGVPITQVDHDSFEVLAFDLYARDRYQIFHAGHPVSGVDISTFAVLSRFYAKDVNSGYIGELRIPDSIGKNFRLLGSSDIYATDSQSIFYQGKTLPVSDPARFRLIVKDVQGQPIPEIYATDEITVFFANESIPNADPASFQVLSVSIGSWEGTEYLAKDNNHHYGGKEVISSP